MIARSPIDAVLPRDHIPTADQRVVMYDVSWTTLETILGAKGERRRPKLTYLQGALELMSPSRDHDQISRTLDTILSVYFAHLGLDFSAYGSWTIKDAEADACLEPDECYVFDDQSKNRPDLAIEVVWTHGGIDKLAAYRRIGVPEVWFWKDDVIAIHVLTETGYEQRPRSELVPGLELERVYRLLEIVGGRELQLALRAEFPLP